MFWVMHTGIIAAIAMVVARYVGYFVALDATGTKLVAIAAIVVLSAINWLGVRQGSAVQTAFTIGKVLAIAGILIAGFALGARMPSAACRSSDSCSTRRSPRRISSSPASPTDFRAFGGC